MLLLFLVKSLLSYLNIFLELNVSLRDKSFIAKSLIGATLDF
jgi:hypothetical protein